MPCSVLQASVYWVACDTGTCTAATVYLKFLMSHLCLRQIIFSHTYVTYESASIINIIITSSSFCVIDSVCDVSINNYYIILRIYQLSIRSNVYLARNLRAVDFSLQRSTDSRCIGNARCQSRLFCLVDSIYFRFVWRSVYKTFSIVCFMDEN